MTLRKELTQYKETIHLGVKWLTHVKKKKNTNQPLKGNMHFISTN